MRKKELLAYVYDFVHFLIDNLDEEIKEIILYGSVARGDFTKKSDIDLFINVKNKKDIKKIEKTVRQTIREFETAASQSWHLRKIDLPFKPIVGELESKQWAALKREIISTGLNLYGKYKEIPHGLKHYLLLSFNLKNLKPKIKVKFIRQLYGYQTKKEKKIYVHFGLIEKEKAAKINPSTILIPVEAHQKFYALFKKFKIQHQIREVWMS